MCQAHHVKPVSQGGATSIDNMVLACWGCHNKIHYFNWQIHGPPGQRTLHPPDTTHLRPAHAREPPRDARTQHRTPGAASIGRAGPAPAQFASSRPSRPEDEPLSNSNEARPRQRLSKTRVGLDDECRYLR